MKLEKAIAILIDSQDMAKPFLLLGYPEAIKLGIEAMKRCQFNYNNPLKADFRRLRGETP